MTITPAKAEKLAQEIVGNHAFASGCGLSHPPLDYDKVARLARAYLDHNLPRWQPIESAPKDGMRIWTFYVVNGCDYAVPIRWLDNENINAIIPGTMPRPRWTKDDGSEFPNPTFWMPLPEPLRLSSPAVGEEES